MGLGEGLVVPAGVVWLRRGVAVLRWCYVVAGRGLGGSEGLVFGSDTKKKTRIGRKYFFLLFIVTELCLYTT